MKNYNVDAFRKPAKGKKPDKKVTHCKLCLRAVSGRQKSTESEDRLVVAGGWREGAWEKLLNRDRVFL